MRLDSVGRVDHLLMEIHEVVLTLDLAIGSTPSSEQPGKNHEVSHQE